MTLGKGWKEFADANDIKIGEPFKMELIWDDKTPMLSLLRAKYSSSKANEEESISSDSSPTIDNRLVTLTLTHEDVKSCKLILPSQFMKANGINRLGKITLLSESGIEWSAYLLTRDGIVSLGNGWEGFCEANGVKLGQCFTLEFSYVQDTTPGLRERKPPLPQIMTQALPHGKTLG
ncbi:PREDICTED: B3 domain-containing protein REM13-like [Camelina sativa]|uniref:B3 domain-containing protein REM13-like n=1 Tax=Camelina sativa TaxID=90675 RepID=A0ABM0WPY0_CAMSA|nr:PREDICTED: B3 domain-containing protein REM13-like [Camelina sativa]